MTPFSLSAVLIKATWLIVCGISRNQRGAAAIADRRIILDLLAHPPKCFAKCRNRLGSAELTKCLYFVSSLTAA